MFHSWEMHKQMEITVLSWVVSMSWKTTVFYFFFPRHFKSPVIFTFLWGLIFLMIKLKLM